MWTRRHETVPPRQGARLEADGTGKIPMPLRSEVSHRRNRMGPSWELGEKKSYSAIIWPWCLILCDVFGDWLGGLSLLALRFRSARSRLHYGPGHYSCSVLVDERFVLAQCDCVNLANPSRHEYSLRLIKWTQVLRNGLIGIWRLHSQGECLEVANSLCPVWDRSTMQKMAVPARAVC